VVAALPVIDSGMYSNGTLRLFGSFPGSISAISVNGYSYTPSNGNSTQAIFNYVTLVDRDVVLVQTVSSDCFATWTFSTAGIEEEDLNKTCIKQNEQIFLFDVTGRQIASVSAPKDFTKKEIFQVQNLFQNLISGVYIFHSIGGVTKKFMQ
jgi:hypothetical protein